MANKTINPKLDTPSVRVEIKSEGSKKPIKQMMVKIKKILNVDPGIKAGAFSIEL